MKRLVRTKLVIGIMAASVLVCAFVLTGCGGSAASSSGNSTATPSTGAGLFMTSLIREKALGQYELAWKSLHPFHQRVAPRGEYVQCENRTAFPGRLLKVSVVRVQNEPVLIAGEERTVSSKAVTIRVSVDYPGLNKPVVVTDTYHAVAVGGHWTWILTRGNFDRYRTGQCPGTAPSTPKA
jgi:hypothetical protein